MITTYDFYTTKYYGDIIPKDSFQKYESFAEDYLHQLTFERLIGVLKYGDKVQKAVCGLAEVIYRIDQTERHTGVNDDGTGKVIKSKSAGNESISYEIIPGAVMSVMTDAKAQEKMKYEVVEKYLSSTGLLYAGL